MANFEVFDRRAMRRLGQPMATVQKKAVLSINLAAYEALGRPAAVELLYDRSKRLMGLRKVDASAAHAYPLTVQGKSTFTVSCKAFFKHYDVETGIARRFAATLVDDVLQIPLSAGDAIEVGRTRRAVGESPP